MKFSFHRHRPDPTMFSLNDAPTCRCGVVLMDEWVDWPAR